MVYESPVTLVGCKYTAKTYKKKGGMNLQFAQGGMKDDN